MHLGTPAERDHLGDHLQRADHPGARPARAARRQVPRDRRDGAPAPQPADLRSRRRDPAVHRHQADRPDRPQRLRRVSRRCGRPVRGRYRILLGMAAGVGKTYRMLQEGQQAQAEGRDVVIGYLEPHDRPETAALAEGLEVVPRLRVAARGARARGDGRRRRHPARARAGADRRARAHERAGHAQREALPGHRRGARRRDRRDLDGQRPAPREPERRDLRADRTSASARRSPTASSTRPTRSCSSTSRPRRSRSGSAPGKVYPRERAEVALQNFFRAEQALGAARARAARGRRGRRGAARHADVLDPLSQQAVAERVLALVDARAAVAADHAARLALGPAARRGDRRALGAQARAAARPRRRRLSSPRSAASRSSSASHFLEEEGRRPRRRPSGASPPSAARPTSSSARPTSRAAARSSAARCVSRMVRELPGIDIRVVADRAERDELTP